jgi:TPR repeat protein
MNLGYCYLRGHGIPSDKVEALRLFRLAVEQGEEKAVKEVERLEGAMGRKKKLEVVIDAQGRAWDPDDLFLDSHGVEAPMRERLQSLADSGLPDVRDDSTTRREC